MAGMPGFSRPFVVYLCGIVLLGLLYEPVKAAAPNTWTFVVGVFLYLFLLRGIGVLLAGRPRSG